MVERGLIFASENIPVALSYRGTRLPSSHLPSRAPRGMWDCFRAQQLGAGGCLGQERGPKGMLPWGELSPSWPAPPLCPQGCSLSPTSYAAWAAPRPPVPSCQDNPTASSWSPTLSPSARGRQPPPRSIQGHRGHVGPIGQEDPQKRAPTGHEDPQTVAPVDSGTHGPQGPTENSTPRPWGPPGHGALPPRAVATHGQQHPQTPTSTPQVQGATPQIQGPGARKSGPHRDCTWQGGPGCGSQIVSPPMYPCHESVKKAEKKSLHGLS